MGDILPRISYFLGNYKSSQISPRVPYQHQQMDEIPLTFFLPILSQTMPQRNPPHQRPLNTTYSGIYIYIHTHACRSQHLYSSQKHCSIYHVLGICGGGGGVEGDNMQHAQVVQQLQIGGKQHKTEQSFHNSIPCNCMFYFIMYTLLSGFSMLVGFRLPLQCLHLPYIYHNTIFTCIYMHIIIHCRGNGGRIHCTIKMSAWVAGVSKELP